MRGQQIQDGIVIGAVYTVFLLGLTPVFGLLSHPRPGSRRRRHGRGDRRRGA
ncbi:MAG TPA: hypothetical protein VHD15_02135 [Hyphomicrobiales bacterium]|nr:hypothetical protein [Hyphomicrobiales bacterium]